MTNTGSVGSADLIKVARTREREREGERERKERKRGNQRWGCYILSIIVTRQL